MDEDRRVYGVRSRTQESERVRFCCDFETEERFSDQFDVFHVDIHAADFSQVEEPLFAKLAEQSRATDWKLFRFMVPDCGSETEVVFSDAKHLAVFDEIDETRPSAAVADPDEYLARCEGKVVLRARTVEGAVAKFLNQRLSSRRPQ